VARALEAELVARLFHSLAETVFSNLFVGAVLHLRQPQFVELDPLVPLGDVSVNRGSTPLRAVFKTFSDFGSDGLI